MGPESNPIKKKDYVTFLLQIEAKLKKNRKGMRLNTLHLVRAMR